MMKKVLFGSVRIQNVASQMRTIGSLVKHVESLDTLLISENAKMDQDSSIPK